MEKVNFSKEQIEQYLYNFKDVAIKIITDPVGFYSDMEKTGGFVEPLLFAIVIGVITGVLQAVLGVVGLGVAGSITAALSMIIIGPILIAIFGFIGAGILHLIWRVLGSRESFETAFRCAAYASAISPITTLLNIIPYIGAVIGILWFGYLMVAASTEVHRILSKPAWIVFGAISLLLCLFSLSAQYTARQFVDKVSSFEKELSKTDNMKPEEAGKALCEFMKGIQKGMDK